VLLPRLAYSALADSALLLLLLLLFSLYCTHSMLLAGAAIWLYPQRSGHTEQPAVSS
jgi:hypothetical protein